jgi:hypothetical protein
MSEDKPLSFLEVEYGLDPTEVDFVFKVIESSTVLDFRSLDQEQREMITRPQIRMAVLAAARSLLDVNLINVIHALFHKAFHEEDAALQLRAIGTLMDFSMPKMPQMIQAKVEHENGESVEDLVSSINDLIEKIGFSGRIQKREVN